MATILVNDLASQGVTVLPKDIAESDDDYQERVRKQYFNYHIRLVKAIPRILHRSDIFNCPIELESGLIEIERKILSGESLKPHLSTRIQDLNYQDDMLSDWGIYHLHLGTNILPNGFVNRTGPLLYARFDNENAYLINIYPHQNWTKQDMIRVLHSNWPDSIANYRLNDVIGLSHVPTDDEVALGRKHHINMGLEIEPGVVYTNIGGGMATDGTSISVTMGMIQTFRIIREYEKIINEHINVIDEKAKANGYNSEEYSFQLFLDENRELHVLELNSNIVIRVGYKLNT
ncbi:MAG: hypothetical protein ACK4EY_13355 [Flavipsychrobacter sp.]